MSRWFLLVSIGALAAAFTAGADPLLASNPEPDVASSIAGYSSPSGKNARIVFVSGTVDAIDKDLFGRTKKVAIVSVSDTGALVQNAVEDESVGEQLKRHVGDDVTARGVVLVKADGAMSLVVDAFEVHGKRSEFVGGEKRRD